LSLDLVFLSKASGLSTKLFGRSRMHYPCIRYKSRQSQDKPVWEKGSIVYLNYHGVKVIPRYEILDTIFHFIPRQQRQKCLLASLSSAWVKLSSLTRHLRWGRTYDHDTYIKYRIKVICKRIDKNTPIVACYPGMFQVSLFILYH
jgi:hypothetical protein